jgi:hypothetical protein
MPFPVGEPRTAHYDNLTGYTLSTVQWNYGASVGQMVESYVATEEAAVLVPKTNFSGVDVPYHATAPGNFAYTVTATFTNGPAQILHGSQPESAPTLSAMSADMGDFGLNHQDLDDDEGGGDIVVMQLLHDDQDGFSLKFQATLPTPDPPNFAAMTGEVACFQTVLSHRTYTPRHGELVELRTPDYVLDSSLPYDDAEEGVDGEDVEVEIHDGPYMWLPPRGFSRVRMDDYFRVYIMYRSLTPGSIWVCLGRKDWSAVCQADQAADNGPWVLSGDGSSVHDFVEDRTLPVWAGNIIDFQEAFNTAVRAAVPAEAAALPSWFSVTGKAPKRRDGKLYRINVRDSLTAPLRHALVQAMEGPLGPVTGAGCLGWLTAAQVQRVQAVAGVSFVSELPVVDRYPQTRAGRVPDFAGEKEYVVSVAPACWADFGGNAAYWAAQTPVNLTTLRTRLSRLVAPRTVTVEAAGGYGRYALRFTAPPGEAVIRSIAQLPYVQSVELKQHFSPGPGPVGPNLE